MKKRILVFPCGSEVALEIYRSMQHSIHFELVGGSSVDDHGKFVYQNYIADIPNHTDPSFSDAICKIVEREKIDAIYPAMDAVLETFHKIANEINIKIIGSSFEVASTCASKLKTYSLLEECVPLPKVFNNTQNLTLPVFVKPDRGYGSRGALRIDTLPQLESHIAQYNNSEMIISEYLPGKEWTIDCFTDRHGVLRFQSPRTRDRISNGISVNTKPSKSHEDDFEKWARSINQKLKPRGAWFFQAKLDVNGEPKLLEVAARLGGSSSIFRCLGVNFALLTVFDAFDQDVRILINSYPIELDRALDARYSIKLNYDVIYVDLDDCLIINNGVNIKLISFIYKSINEKKRIILITRHAGMLSSVLDKYRLSNLFDEVIHIKNKCDKKSQFIANLNSIFIDDSYSERCDVANVHGINTFSPDMVEALI
jgi:hypothetical protein